MTPLISVLFLCIFSFHRSDGAAVPDVCSDNTLDTQQVWKYVVNGKEWLTIAAIVKNVQSIEGLYLNPKFKFSSGKGHGQEGDIDMEIVYYDKELEYCDSFLFQSLRPRDEETGINQRCQRTTGRSTDRFAVLRSEDSRGIWFRFFSQNPEEYVWVFVCFNSTAYDYDSCQKGHMDLMITDPRTEKTDSINLEENIRDKTGLITTDDTRFIGHMMSPVDVLWGEGEERGRECEYVNSTYPTHLQ